MYAWEVYIYIVFMLLAFNVTLLLHHLVADLTIMSAARVRHSKGVVYILIAIDSEEHTEAMDS